MKRLLALVLAVMGVGWAALAAGKLYDHPTWAQMERAIAAAEGVPYVPRPSSKTDPTFDQMERLIKAVGSGGGGITNAVTLEAFAYATNRLDLSKVGTNDFVSATNELHVVKRDKDDLAVYRKVKDIWTWTTHYSNKWSTAEAPADFLETANSPGTMPLYFRGGKGAHGGWFGANQYWPNGNLKYDQGYDFSGDLGELSTNLYFAFTAYAEDGRTELFRFGAKAHRESATDETVTNWFDYATTPYPIRLATTDMSVSRVQFEDEAVRWTKDQFGNRTAVSVGERWPSEAPVGIGSLTVGYSAASGDGSVSVGSGASAGGEASVAVGIDTKTTEGGMNAIAAGTYSVASNVNAVVWQGDDRSLWYGSHGHGTLNVNPRGGLSGLYVGETNLRDHVEAIVGAHVAPIAAQTNDVLRYLRVVDFFDTFDDDADWYADWADEHGYCASLRVGNIYVRNYDWKYTEAMTYVGRLPAATGRYASVFVCNVGTNLTPAIEATGEWTRFHRALPGRAVDGINEKGVVCNINVVPTNGVPWETRGGERDLSLTRACRYVLDNFDNARAAADYVAVHGYVPDALKNQGFSIHMMIADTTGSYIVEDGEVGEFAVSMATGTPAYMTNARVVTNQETDYYGSGIERYFRLKDAASADNPERAATVAITNIWYTHGYIRDNEHNYPWPTEFAGVIAVTNVAGSVTNVVDAPTGSPWEYKLQKSDITLLQQACNLVIPDVPHDRWPRDGSSWQTIHCSVYDISNRCLRIAVQEDPRWTVVSVPAGSLDELIAYGTNYVNAAVDEIRRLPCTTELTLTQQQIDKGVTFMAYGANQNSAVEIGRGAVSAMSQDYVSSVQANKTLRSVGIAIGAYAEATNADVSASHQSIAIGFTSAALGSQSIALGSGARHYIGETNLNGDNTYAKGGQSVAVGYSVKVLAEKGTAIGSSTGSNGDKAHPENPDVRTSVTAPEATAIGFDARAAGQRAVSLGSNVKAAGVKSVAIGGDAFAIGDSAVQIGAGTNTAPNTLKFQDVVIVKDGHVTGAVPDPQQVDPTHGTASDELEFTVAPGSMTTVLPTMDCGPGTEMGVSCSAPSNRNYTIFLPNEPQLRVGLPGSFQFEVPMGVRGTSVGPTTFTTLPVRIGVEQPYGKLVVVNVTSLDDGYDWTPSVTNHTLVYRIDAAKGENRLIATNATMSILGESLHCATNVTFTYLNDAETPQERTVEILTLPAGKGYMSQTFYGYAGGVNLLVEDTDWAPKRHIRPDDTQYVDGTLTYRTLHGSVSTNLVIDVEFVD